MGGNVINWVWYPKSEEPASIARAVVEVFELALPDIQHLTSADDAVSDAILRIVCPGFQNLGFEVETGKRAAQKVRVPVLFGRNGQVEKAFEADAWHRTQKMVIEVEAGRGYLNNQFLKDLFQACMMHDVHYCGIAVRNKYKNSHDFERVVSFFEALYASNRLQLPLKGILLVGY